MLKKVTAILLLLLPAIYFIYPQDFISGTVNEYLKVDSIYADTILYSGDASNFNPGDKVLLIQMTGVDLFYEGLGVGGRGIADRGTRLSDRNTGRYEILQVDEVIAANSKMIFTSDFLNTYNNGEKIQLVKVHESDNAVINGTLSAAGWDGEKGGILAMIVFDTLTFQSDINVSNNGFRGAMPETGFTGTCRPASDTVNFLPGELNRAGNKGEGNVRTSFPYTKGLYWAATGGGGGNGVFAGGGGGSNYGRGGDGGTQVETCDPNYPPVAMGGIKGDDYYDDGRIVMGGGGGSGVQSSTTTASKGGDGGGIVIIAAGVVVGNNQNIYANGEAITGLFDASGGGGGAGGTVLIDATTFSGNLNISVKGGKGGNTGANCTGSGGGGGGGVFWYSGQQEPSYAIDTVGGVQGSVSGCATFGTPGQPGKTYSSLILPLNGFLFNVIRGKDTICAGKQPNTIIGSNPKGGDGNYTFKWEQSPDDVLWTPAVGTGADQRDFTPASLFSTTYFRRIVNAGGAKPQADTVSKSVEVFVYPAISNNNIYGIDTICYNLTPLPITGDQPTGGDGTNYAYQWQSSTNLSAWSDESLFTTNQPLSPGSLTASTYYRRYVTSTSYCSGYSDTVMVTVLPSIGNNVFTPLIDTVICEGDSPGVLKAAQPTDGDGLYNYLWQSEEEINVWTDIAGSNMQEINVGPLTTTTSYKRIVFSGNDDACIDTSGIKMVTVLPSITNNTITTDSSRYCEGDVPNIITGSSPSDGGGPGSYSYTWMINTGSSWDEISGADEINYSHGTLSQSAQFMRIVISGTYDACKDTTSPLNLTVIPAVINNLDLPDQTICENNTPLSFGSSPATGGNGSYTYEWQVKPAAGGSWSPAQGVNNNADYTSGSLTDSSLFIRKVTSDICVKLSDTVNVFVFKRIKNNVITGNQLKYACYNTGEQLSGSQHTDGNPGDYAYLWQMSDDLSGWSDATGKGSNSERNFETNDLVSPMYYRRLVLSSASSAECIDTSDYAQVLINDLPTGNLISSLDTTCAGGTIMISYNVNGNHGPWDVTIGNESFSETKQTGQAGFDSIPVVFDSYQDVRLISVIDDSLCAADLSSATEQVSVTVYEIPVANPGDDFEVCGNQHTLSAIKSIAGSIGLWQTNMGIFDDPSLEDATITINGFTSGISEGYLKWTETNWKCSDSDSIFMTFYEQPVDIDAGTDRMLNFQFQTTLDAATPLIGSGIWTVSTGEANFDDETLPYTYVSGLDYDNTLVWTVTNGLCPSVEDSVSIVVGNLTLSRGITPGSGTTGELFKVEIENAERVELTIFNRLGQVVFESDNYGESNFWDGTNKNDAELPEGTYFYVLKVRITGKETEFIFKSYIELVR